jgi:hypothetical protein
MSVPNRQIGWSQESNLLWYILSQLKRLASVIYGMKPKYKVFTATLTQAGESSVITIDFNNSLVIGVTYQIVDTDGDTVDFTNVGAPNNDYGTFFIATGTVPTSWGDTNSGQLNYDEGAPIANVLENTIGDVWFDFRDTGHYALSSNGLFTENKTVAIMGTPYLDGNPETPGLYSTEWRNTDAVRIYTYRIDDTPSDSYLFNTFLEVRIYN